MKRHYSLVAGIISTAYMHTSLSWPKCLQKTSCRPFLISVVQGWCSGPPFSSLTGSIKHSDRFNLLQSSFLLVSLFAYFPKILGLLFCFLCREHCAKSSGREETLTSLTLYPECAECIETKWLNGLLGIFVVL